MQKTLSGRWWLAALLLTVSCRSEQAVFSFRPAAPPVSSAAPVAAVPPAATSLAAPAAPAPVVAETSVTVAPLPKTVSASARPGLWRPARAVARLRQPALVRVMSRPETAGRATHPDTLHWVLGAALVVAGVVGGLLLGGWLGLGVGAALVLLGYYFVLKALGGRQAWLEVFQEFFNM